MRNSITDGPFRVRNYFTMLAAEAVAKCVRSATFRSYLGDLRRKRDCGYDLKVALRTQTYFATAYSESSKVSQNPPEGGTWEVARAVPA